MHLKEGKLMLANFSFLQKTKSTMIPTRTFLQEEDTQSRFNELSEAATDLGRFREQCPSYKGRQGKPKGERLCQFLE
jgi:CRISPR/Cas system CSM-associated protein Csm2 small subunit